VVLGWVSLPLPAPWFSLVPLTSSYEGPGDYRGLPRHSRVVSLHKVVDKELQAPLQTSCHLTLTQVPGSQTLFFLHLLSWVPATLRHHALKEFKWWKKVSGCI
jgi:hypothetical protein